MLKFILTVLGVLSALGCFIVVIFMSSVKMETQRIQMKKKNIRQNLVEYSRKKKKIKQTENEVDLAIQQRLETQQKVEDESAEVSDGPTFDAEGKRLTYGASMRKEQDAILKDFDTPKEVDFADISDIENFDHTPLSEDLKVGAKGFVDKFLVKLSKIQELHNKEQQLRAIKFLEFQLYMLNREKSIHPDVHQWATGELKSLKFRVGRDPSSKKK